MLRGGMTHWAEKLGWGRRGSRYRPRCWFEVDLDGLLLDSEGTRLGEQRVAAGCRSFLLRRVLERRWRRKLDLRGLLAGLRGLVRDGGIDRVMIVAPFSESGGPCRLRPLRPWGREVVGWRMHVMDVEIHQERIFGLGFVGVCLLRLGLLAQMAACRVVRGRHFLRGELALLVLALASDSRDLDLPQLSKPLQSVKHGILRI